MPALEKGHAKGVLERLDLRDNADWVRNSSSAASVNESLRPAASKPRRKSSEGSRRSVLCMQ